MTPLQAMTTSLARVSPRPWRISEIAPLQQEALAGAVSASQALSGGRVFIGAYGSLSPDPEPGMRIVGLGTAENLEIQASLLEGERRGQPDSPGVIVTARLCPGSSAAVAVAEFEATADHLQRYEARELDGKGYMPFPVPVVLQDGETVAAIVLLTWPEHPADISRMSAVQIARIAYHAPAGTRGTSLGYLRSVVHWRRRAQGGRLDPHLQAVSDALRTMFSEELE